MSRTRYIAQAGVIAAVYGGLTWLTLAFGGALAWGPIQFRVSEAATVLALFTPAAIPGLALGSVVANLLNPQAVWPFSALDVVLGSLGTLLGAAWTWRLRHKPLLALGGPVVTNAFIVASYLPILLRGIGVPMPPVLGLSLNSAWPTLYAVLVCTIGIGQAVVVYGLGLPLSIALHHNRVAERLGGR